MSHELVEKLGGLASRANDLAVNQTGAESRQLLELQDRLSKLTLAAIVKDLNDEDKAYQLALDAVNEAIGSIGDADKKIKNVSNIIALISRAATLTEKVLSVTGV